MGSSVGKLHIDYVKALNNLGLIQAILGKYNNALKSFE